MKTCKEIIDNLDFQPFKYEVGPPFEGATYMRPTKETRARVQPGAVLKLKTGGFYLVGDCNAILGVCDDCCEFGYEDIAEIAYLWEPEQPVSETDDWEENLKAELAERGMLNKEPEA